MLALALAPGARAKPPPLVSHPLPVSVLGVDGLSLQGGPVTLEQLVVLEETLPEHFYSFPVESSTRRLDASRFDPFLDTPPFQNPRLEGLSNGVCFGFANQVLEWHQLWLRGQGIVDRAEPGQPVGVLLPVREPLGRRRQLMGPPLVRLREHVTQEAGAVEMMRRAVELHPTQFQLGRHLTPETLVEVVQRDLGSAHLGSTQVNLLFKDLDGNTWMPHSWVAYRVYEGLAVSQARLEPGPDDEPHVVAARGPNAVRALRIDLWDSNVPYGTQAKAEDHDEIPYLIYFPKAHKLSLPRNSWYDYYEGHMPEMLPASQREKAAVLRRSMTLLQRDPTFLGDEASLQYSEVNDPRRRAKRQRLLLQGSTLMDKLRGAVRADPQRMAAARTEIESEPRAARRGFALSLEQAYWHDTQDRVVERAVDQYLLDHFPKVP